MSTPPDHARIIPSTFDDGWLLEINGDIQSHVDPSEPDVLRFEYLRRIGHVLDLCWSPVEPIRILHLGAGALTIVRYIQATRPGSEQTVIELDPELIPLVTSELPLPTGTDLRTITGDARYQLRELEEVYFDCIIVDIFTGHNTATHLTDEDYYHELMTHLADSGIVMVNIGDDEGLKFFAQQAQALHNVAVEYGLGGVWTLADAGTLHHRHAGNMVIAAGPGFPTNTPDVTTLCSRLSAAGPHPSSVLTPNETATLSGHLSQ